MTPFHNETKNHVEIILPVASALAGIVVVFITVLIEKWGGIIGGVFGMIPSTIVVSAIALYLELPYNGFVEAMFTAPAGMVVSVIFLFMWRLIPKLLFPKLKLVNSFAQLGAMLVLSLGWWFTASVGVYFLIVWLKNTLHVSVFWIGSVSYAFKVILSLWACYHNPPTVTAPKRPSIIMLCARGVVAAAITAIAVFMASLDQPIVAGLASIFPAIFLTTMIALWISQGDQVPIAAVGPLMLGVCAVPIFLFSFAFLVSVFNKLIPDNHGAIFVAALFSELAAIILVSFPAFLFLLYQNSKKAMPKESIKQPLLDEASIQNR